MKVYHFHNGAGGGVLAVISNLLQFSNDLGIENHVIYTINKDEGKSYQIKKLKGATSEQIFFYSPSWNFYYTCKQLSKLLPDEKVLVVAHDWLELGMMCNLGLQNPVIHIVHGDYEYYYDLAIKNSAAIDIYICVSNKICTTLRERMQDRQMDIYHQNFPVPSIHAKKVKNSTIYIIYYVSNLHDPNKQFSLIIEIANLLGNTQEDYYFTIAGAGIAEPDFFRIWPHTMKNRVSFIGFQSNETILELLPAQDIFILPSLWEGLPVSLIEAMKAGVVPLVTNWGGVDEIMQEGITGYSFEPNSASAYANCIRKLSSDRGLLKQLSHNCIQKANGLFDPVNNTKNFEDLYYIVCDKNIRKKKAVKVYGSRLDQPWLMNSMALGLRFLSKM